MIKSISSFSPVFKGIDVYKLRAKNGDEKDNVEYTVGSRHVCHYRIGSKNDRNSSP